MGRVVRPETTRPTCWRASCSTPRLQMTFTGLSSVLRSRPNQQAAMCFALEAENPSPREGSARSPGVALGKTLLYTRTDDNDDGAKVRISAKKRPLSLPTANRQRPGGRG